MSDASFPKPSTSTEDAGDTCVCPVDDLVATRHTLSVGGDSIAYRAHAGRVVLREEASSDGVFRGLEARAEVFIVSYQLEEADPTTRPVTFVFNGGGPAHRQHGFISASWVHASSRPAT